MNAWTFPSPRKVSLGSTGLEVYLRSWSRSATLKEIFDDVNAVMSCLQCHPVLRTGSRRFSPLASHWANLPCQSSATLTPSRSRICKPFPTPVPLHRHSLNLEPSSLTSQAWQGAVGAKLDSRPRARTFSQTLASGEEPHVPTRHSL